MAIELLYVYIISTKVIWHIKVHTSPAFIMFSMHLKSLFRCNFMQTPKRWLTVDAKACIICIDIFKLFGRNSVLQLACMWWYCPIIYFMPFPRHKAQTVDICLSRCDGELSLRLSLDLCIVVKFSWLTAKGLQSPAHRVCGSFLYLQ